jgi:hypothetical protein
MERRAIQRSQDLRKFENPNPGLHEYKVKTGRSYPNTKEEWEVFKTWQKGTHAWLQTQACRGNSEVYEESEQEEEEGEVRWESWHPACSAEDDRPNC